ncbi:MAG TPA: polysaccharide biosynthesis tyrosine autokinase [Bacteroidales bacterium]|nr:polysaccharide biosynthesis tyrosine autokinase [Bacteroidales bacterium]
MDPNYPSQPNFPEDENIDIKRYLSLFISNWYWFAITLFIAVTLAYGINRYSEKIYTVSSSLLIKDDQMANMSGNVASILPGGDIFKSQQNLINEMGILRSFRLNYAVMEKLKDFHVIYVGVGRRKIVESRMYNTCPFRVVYDSLEVEPKGFRVDIEILSEEKYRISLDGDLNFVDEMSFGDRFTEFGFDFTIEKRIPGDTVCLEDGSNRYYFWFTEPGALATEYRAKLSVAPIEKDASLVALSVSGSVPRQEADYLNTLMREYIGYGVDNKNRTADSTIKFIDAQLNIISDSLSKAEEKLESFRLKNRFVDLSREGSLIQNRLEKFENERASFNLQLQYYNYLSEYLNIKNTGGAIFSPSVMGIADPVLIRLVNELSAYQKEMERIGFNISGDQPAHALLNKQTDEAREALRENVKNGIAGLKQIIAESDRKISGVEIEISKLPSTERNFINIQRVFDLNNTVYTYLLEKRSESGIARASNVSDNRIIDPASFYSSALIKPKARNNIIIALILGLMLPAALIALIDFFNDKVIDKKDIERKTKVPVIGYISHKEGKSEILVVEKPGSSLAESFRSVRTAIKYFVKENEVSVIAVLSTISMEGKTFIAVNLAAITAMLGKRVLLVGLDLRKPRINRVFEFDDSPGMSTYLSGNCNYEEIIKKTQIDNLFYAPSGPIPPNPAELIETELMKKFMERAKKEYDYIIIDTPPVAIVTDALLLARFVDVNLFIVRQRYSSRNTLELIDQLNNHGELKNMAIVINDISLTGYYGYGMRYGYAQGYGYSYGLNYYNRGYYGRYGYSDKTQGYYTEE